jgi:3-oxoacyl-[acyl-carrier protein] reductase
MTQLAGKTALITGASRGIGAAIALAFARAGADVVITYNSSAEAAEQLSSEARAAGVRAQAIRADAGSAEDVRRSVREAVEFFGGQLDILVNNAGIFKRRALHEASDDEFDAVMAVNVRGVFIACKEAAGAMGGGGRIINLGSSFGARVPAPGLGLYATSKFAVAGMTRALARDLAPKGITVNAIQPGPIATDMNPPDDRHGRIMAMMTALGRYGTAEDVANVALFLALPQSSYITGAVLAVDGGFET